MSSPDSALLDLIAEFVRRQRLVRRLLRELRPDFFPRRDQVPPPPSKERLRGTFRGTWGPSGEWRYFIHGRGCRLTHVRTGEPIEWDAPLLRRFDAHWFANWVLWRLARPESRSLVEPLPASLAEDVSADAIRRALKRLLEQGLLQQPDPEWEAYVLPDRR